MKNKINNENDSLTCSKQLVTPVLEYASCAWDALTKTQETSPEAVQRKAARLVCCIRRTDRKTSVSGLIQRLGWEKLEGRTSFV